MTSTNTGVIHKFTQMMKIDFKTILIIILILLMVGGYYFHTSRIDKIKADKEISDKLNAALTDTLRIYAGENGTLKYEKLAMQADISDLKNGNITLTKEKKELIKAVERISKDKVVLAATIIKQQFIIDSLSNISIAGDFTDSTTVKFVKHNSDSINFNISVTNVAEINGLTPELTIDSLSIPNSVIVSFNWDKDKRKDYPVSVSVENSNPLMKVNNIEAFAIPELNKEAIKPTFWQKVKKGLKKFKDNIVIFGAGVLVGGAIVGGLSN